MLALWFPRPTDLSVGTESMRSFASRSEDVRAAQRAIDANMTLLVDLLCEELRSPSLSREFVVEQIDRLAKLNRMDKVAARSILRRCAT